MSLRSKIDAIKKRNKEDKELRELDMEIGRRSMKKIAEQLGLVHDEKFNQDKFVNAMLDMAYKMRKKEVSL